MSKEIFEALKGIQQSSGVPAEALIEKIQQGIIKAIKRDYPDTENIRVEMDPEKEIFEMSIIKTVVEEVLDPANEITIDEARTHHPNIAMGEPCEIVLNPAAFGRVAASSAKQSIRSDLKQFERDRLVAAFSDKEHELVTATVQKVEPATGNAVITIGTDEIYFPRGEQIPGERLKPGDIIKVYVVGVINPDRKPSIKVSRSCREFVKRLFELEVPEVFDGTVEIKAVSREAGSRSKIAVYSNNPDIDPIGTCIGPKRSRIAAVMQELHGEKIDLIPYSEDDAEFVAKALAPAEVVRVEIRESEQRICTAVVPSNQLSLAIGNKGQNAKLAARLTGYKIDIISVEDAEKAAEEALTEDLADAFDDAAAEAPAESTAEAPEAKEEE